MTVFAISDLHLQGGDVKPMDVFGAHWERHFERIVEDWRARVRDEDIVLIPGDISWAMHFEDALPDLNSIGRLPGRKLLVRGNHDYWWSSVSRLRAALPDGMYALQNDALLLDGVLFAGTRGWMPGATEADKRIYEREINRMGLSLQAARKLSPTAELVVMTHYPPFGENSLDSPFTRLMDEYDVTYAVYGHLHGAAIQNAYNGIVGHTQYALVSCDSLEFKLLHVFD